VGLRYGMGAAMIDGGGERNFSHADGQSVSQQSRVCVIHYEGSGLGLKIM
jgi:hypothetical protein